MLEPLCRALAHLSFLSRCLRFFMERRYQHRAALPPLTTMYGFNKIYTCQLLQLNTCAI